MTKQVAEMTVDELKAVMGNGKKKKMRSDKKYFIIFMSWCILIQVITLYFAMRLSSELLFSIFATEAVLGPVYTYKQYLQYKKDINLKHMEVNYIENYDDINGIK